VRPTKGIGEVIEAAERFGDEVSVDVYGPFLDGLTEDIFQGRKRVRYHGILPSDNVVDTLRGYDALLLPTYWRGEGYPGIIVEAYIAGIPVITTKWAAVPEIVDESCGLLIEPRDVDALHAAMQSLVDDPALLDRLRTGAIAKRSFFDSAVWTQKFVDYCHELAPRTAIASPKAAGQ
jgi:glycosyltransferase involved in cell wall biosynthesis